MADDKKLNLPDFRKALVEGLKSRIEDFAKQCEDLKKAEAGELAKKSPPGKAKEVEELKAKGLPASEAFGIAWQQYKAKNKGMKKGDLGDPGVMDMGMSEQPMDKGEMSAADKKKFPSLADDKEEKDEHPSKHAGEKETTKMAKKPMAKSEMCKSCGMSKAMCKCMGMSKAEMTHAPHVEAMGSDKKSSARAMAPAAITHVKEKHGAMSPVEHKEMSSRHAKAALAAGGGAKSHYHAAMANAHGVAAGGANAFGKSEADMAKTQTYINPEESNQQDPDKRLKTFGGKGAKEPTPCKEVEASGSGEGAEKLHPLKKDELKPGHTLQLQPVGQLPKADESKVKGHVARIHEAAKAKMAKGMGGGGGGMGGMGMGGMGGMGRGIEMVGDKNPKDNVMAFSKAVGMPGKQPSMPTSTPPAPPMAMSKDDLAMAGSEKSPEGSKELKKEHLGFEKLKNKLAHKKGINDPAALSAAIGRKKYGAKGMAAKAKAGKK